MRRRLLAAGDPRLRRPCAAVDVVTPEISKLVDDLAETMYAHRGVGLAAPQVGVMLRVFVADVRGAGGLQAFINPEITARDGTAISSETCLSLPGIARKVKRSETVTVRALDRAGVEFELHATGLLAAAIQHETDHLAGVLITGRRS